MFSRRVATERGLLALVAVILAGCGAATPSPTALPTAAPTPSPAVAVAKASPSELPTATPDSGTGMKVRFVNLTDGGTAAGTADAKGRPLVTVQIEVTGLAPLVLDLTANGLPAVDVGGRALSVMNPSGAVPFQAAIPWSPPNGGGAYTLVATAIDNNKIPTTATIHITVTGVPSFTLPPALTRAQAIAKVTKLIQDTYKVAIPSPSLQRFDFPTNPTRSRWIGAAYYKGMRYYVSIFDDGHVEWSNGPYADPTHRSTTGSYTYCRPAGTVRVLVVFVDYGNTGTVKEDALAKVPGTVSWLNGLYAAFATSQGLAAPLLRVEADATYIGSPPAPGELLTAAQIRSLTGKDTAAYSFVMQIDLDSKGSFAAKNFPGTEDAGGGFALEACGTAGKFGPINIWSSVAAGATVQGGLSMDFDHELSHMFGMMDDWPFTPGIAGPAGTTVDDWIPYTMFGWTDTDGDGVPEIIDPTPYGTTGPQP